MKITSSVYNPGMLTQAVYVSHGKELLTFSLRPPKKAISLKGITTSPHAAINDYLQRLSITKQDQMFSQYLTFSGIKNITEAALASVNDPLDIDFFTLSDDIRAIVDTLIDAVDPTIVARMLETHPITSVGYDEVGVHKDTIINIMVAATVLKPVMPILRWYADVAETVCGEFWRELITFNVLPEPMREDWDCLHAIEDFVGNTLGDKASGLGHLVPQLKQMGADFVIDWAHAYILVNVLPCVEPMEDMPRDVLAQMFRYLDQSQNR